jgi:hypothetical protein
MIIEYEDSKGEGCRLLNHFPDDVAIFRPDQVPVNYIAPSGPIEPFFWTSMTALARAFMLHLATYPEAAEILIQISRGLKPGDPPPSLIDCRNIFHKLAQEGYPKFASVAGAFAELSSFLGRTAFIRRGPDFYRIARVIVYEQIGIPYKIRSFLTAIRFARLQAEAATEGRAGDQLRRVIIMDEGQDAFSKELSQLTGSGYIAPAKRLLTQGRSTGAGIVASVPSLRSTDEILLGAAATAVVFRCPEYAEALKAAELLGDSRLAPSIQHSPDRVVHVRSAGFSGPVAIRLPEFDLGPYPSDAEVQRLMAPKLAALAAQTEYAPDSPEEQPTLDYLAILNQRPQPVTAVTTTVTQEIRRRFLADHKAFLRELRDNPAVSVTQHYRHLRWGVGRGHRIKNELLQMMLICVERQESTSGRPIELLLLTQTGEALLNESTQ